LVGLGSHNTMSVETPIWPPRVGIINVIDYIIIGIVIVIMSEHNSLVDLRIRIILHVVNMEIEEF